MKIECPIDFMDLDILGFIDHNITVNIISNEQVVDKKILRLPKEITNVIRCKKPKMYHIHRAGTGSHLCPDRRREPGVPLQILRRKILRKINKKTNGNVVFTDHVPVIYLKILWQYMSRT